MGQFSWTSVHNHLIPIMEGYEAAVLIPKEFGGGFIYEPCYDGYGDFDYRDMYGLIVEWNKPEEFKSDRESRNIGIDLACYEKDHARLKYPIKIVSFIEFEGIDENGEDRLSVNKELKSKVINGELTYEDFKGFSLSDPNQGWGMPSGSDISYLNGLYEEYIKPRL